MNTTTDTTAAPHRWGWLPALLLGLAALVAVALLPACTATSTGYHKDPALLGDTVAERFALDMDGLAGEALLWDKFNGNIALMSTKDEGLSDLHLSIAFADTGEMASLDLSIGTKTAVSSTPSQVAWDGLGKAIDAYLGPDGLAGAIGIILREVATPAP